MELYSGSRENSEKSLTVKASIIGVIHRAHYQFLHFCVVCIFGAKGIGAARLFGYTQAIILINSMLSPPLLRLASHCHSCWKAMEIQVGNWELSCLLNPWLISADTSHVAYSYKPCLIEVNSPFV